MEDILRGILSITLCGCMALIGLGGPALLVFLVLRLTRKGNTRFVEPWQQAGEALGLTIETTGLGGPVLTGTYQGRTARAYISPGIRNNPARTVYTLSHNNLTIPVLRVLRQASGVIMGSKGIEIGDPDFDSAFTIMCDDREAAANLLDDPALREALTSLTRAMLHVESGKVTLSEIGRQMDPTRIQAQFELVTLVAQRVDDMA